RRNGGGSLDEAINLTGLFIPSGPVVQVRRPNGGVEVGGDDGGATLYDGPLFVRGSRFSASASEILAGALQDYGRALVVGDHSTFGKGTVQNVVPLASVMKRMGLVPAYDPGALKVTTNKFYRPGGGSTQLRGVASDIVLPSPSDFSDVNESALERPLPWDAVPPAPHELLNRVHPYVDQLREQSNRRVAADKDFGYLAEDVARLKKRLAAKSVSLNEAERRRELAQSKARQEEYERDARARQASRPATYEITLQNVSTQGLPPRVALKKAPSQAPSKDESPKDKSSDGETAGPG